MSSVATYAQRLAALPRALGILELHPEGLPLAALAEELGESPNALREVFLAYYRADLVEIGRFEQPVIEFFSPGTPGRAEAIEDADPATAEWVRVVARDPEQELGVNHLNAEQLARLWAAGSDLLVLEPDNTTLRAALEAFRSALWPVDPQADDGAAPGGEGPPDDAAEIARLLHRAVKQQQRARIGYVRQWRPGGGDRVIDPYRLVRTRRGWEVDAGPPDEVAAVRTYLVSGITGCELLDEHFAHPPGLDRDLAEARAPVTVELVVPQDRRWAVERYAETVTVLADDEESVALRAELLPPVEQRLGLLLLVCGPEAFVVAPAGLADAGLALARELRSHHHALPAPDLSDNTRHK